MGCVNEALEQQGYLGVKIRQQRRGAEKVMENAFYLTLGGRCVGGETCVHLERYLPPSLTPARTPSPVQPSPQLSHEHFLLLPHSASLLAFAVQEPLVLLLLPSGAPCGHRQCCMLLTRVCPGPSITHC